MTIYAWERAMQGWVRRVSAPWERWLTVVNFLLADEVVVLAGVLPVLFWLAGPPSLIVGVSVLATSTKVEDKLKAFFDRGRPRNPNEWGIPSGDCLLVSVWAPVAFGWWSTVPIAIVMWARMARDAHWPLDVVVGVVLGLWLVSPALVWR